MFEDGLPKHMLRLADTHAELGSYHDRWSAAAYVARYFYPKENA